MPRIDVLRPAFYDGRAGPCERVDCLCEHGRVLTRDRSPLVVEDDADAKLRELGVPGRRCESPRVGVGGGKLRARRQFERETQVSR